MFLDALARTGNVARAAEASGASKAGLYKQRKRNPGFAREWDAALAGARKALAVVLAERSAPPDRWVRKMQGGHPQDTRRRARGWSARREARFLESLAEDCHVRRAAEAAGVCEQTCFIRRRTYPDFAAAWDAAIAEGRVRLSMKLLRQAANGTRADEAEERRLIAEPDEDAAIEDTGLALGLLRLAEAREGRGSGRDRNLPRPRSIEEVRASILAKLDAIEAHERREGRGDSPLPPIAIAMGPA